MCKISGNKCSAVVFIMTFWVQPLADETWRKSDKDSLVTTVIRGLSEWLQLFSLETVEELLHLHPWVAKALFPLHFLIYWVMHSSLSVSAGFNYCHSQSTLSRLCSACIKKHGEQDFIPIPCLAFCCFGWSNHKMHIFYSGRA